MTAPQPTQRDVDEAMQVLASTDRTYQRYGFSEDKLPRLTGSIALALASRDAEWREKCKAFLDESGEPRKVLGTLVLTMDGCIVGHKATVYGSFWGASPYEMVMHEPEFPATPWEGPVPASQTWSSRSAAEAARKEGV